MPSGTVLVVDDDPVIVNLLQVNFEIEGYDVLAATGGEAGLAQARTGHPDVIVLDVMMPGIDGLEVARRLRADDETRSIPIILLSAKAQSSDIQAGLAVADEYMTKPFEPLELLERVKTVLTRSQGHVQPAAEANRPASPDRQPDPVFGTPARGANPPAGPGGQNATVSNGSWPQRGRLGEGSPPEAG